MTSSRDADIAGARGLVDQALAASPRNTSAHMAKGQLLRTQRRCDEAIPEFETVIASNRNASGAYFALGVCKLQTGQIDETIPLEEQAIRLSPRDPNVFNRYLVIGEVHLLQSRIEEAISWLEKARIGNLGSPWPHAWLAAAYALKGDSDRAAAELAEARKLLGGGAYSSIATIRTGYWGVPAIRELHETTFFAGLRSRGARGVSTPVSIGSVSDQSSMLTAPRRRRAGLSRYMSRCAICDRLNDLDLFEQGRGEMSQTRRLAAILAADVAGYSRLMGDDEEGTHERLKAHLRELVDPKIEEHHGRTVKNTGDGFLAEFPSVVDAVRCAVAIQRGMVDRNADTPEDKRISFRIGVNLGDVIVEDHDVFGNA
jgi:tetratricopeptide (TPR) repeat protein